MSAGEFGRWLAFLALEELGPGAQQHQWAALMAAVHNGALKRKNGKFWSPADFMPQPQAQSNTRQAARGSDAKAHIAQQRAAISAQKA